MKPSFSTPARMQITPDTMARAPAMATARAGSDADCATTTARMRGASEESGPSTRMRLGPNTA